MSRFGEQNALILLLHTVLVEEEVLLTVLVVEEVEDFGSDS